MKTVVQGKNVVMFIYDGGIWKLYACAKSCTLVVVTDFIETSVSGAGVWSTFKPTRNSFTGNITGIVNLEVVGMLSLGDLRQRQAEQVLLTMRYQRTSNEGNVYTEQADFYISSSQDDGSFDDVNVFSIGLRGTGPLTAVTAPTPITPPGCVGVSRYEYVGVGEESFFVADGTGGTDDIRGKDILEANKDGEAFRIILSGTPVGKEVLYTSATGRFDWSIPWETGEQGYILYQ